MEEEFLLDAGAAGVENFQPVRRHLDRPGVPQEVWLGGLALEDGGDADRPTHRAVGGGIEPEAVVRERDLCGGDPIPVRLRPDEGQAFQISVRRGLGLAHRCNSGYSQSWKPPSHWNEGQRKWTTCRSSSKNRMSRPRNR